LTRSRSNIVEIPGDKKKRVKRAEENKTKRYRRNKSEGKTKFMIGISQRGSTEKLGSNNRCVCHMLKEERKERERA
jgi:hypothetical protein